MLDARVGFGLYLQRAYGIQTIPLYSRESKTLLANSVRFLAACRRVGVCFIASGSGSAGKFLKVALDRILTKLERDLGARLCMRSVPIAGRLQVKSEFITKDAVEFTKRFERDWTDYNRSAVSECK